jgi:hypothetical protein
MGGNAKVVEVTPFTHVWYWRARLPDRKGQPCRVLARGALNSALVEFADGAKVITSRYAVRKSKPPAETIERTP